MTREEQETEENKKDAKQRGKAKKGLSWRDNPSHKIIKSERLKTTISVITKGKKPTKRKT